MRVRPPNQRETISAHGNVVHVLDDRVLTFDPPGERVKKQTFLQMGQQPAKNLHFGFDKVLGPDSSQEDVFDVVKESIFAEEGGLLDGFNCTVFAYGATGSGKTFSMAGTPENPGLMSRAVQHIFAELEKQSGRRAKLKMSYLEIYNEQIRDLLALPGSKAKMKIVNDPEHGITVTGLRHCNPTTTDEVLDLIQLGNNRRTQAQTDANPVSSRSHAVCQITVENCEELPGLSSDHPIGKLSLIDLAGSERATTNTGIRLKESAKINCSLLALSNCINALCTQRPFIPFRQSKLTRLLQDSLGGNCKTVCLSCISPSYMSYDDTYSTLQYANKTKNIRTNITRNMLNVDARVSQYPKIIADLRAQISTLQNGQGKNTSATDAFRKSIEAPFQELKNAIQIITNREIQDISTKSTSDQIYALRKLAVSDLKRKMNQKISGFTADCDKRRPSSVAASVHDLDSEQRMKVLELENLALRSQLEIREKQITVQENVIRSLHDDLSAPRIRSLSEAVAAKLKSIDDQLEADLDFDIPLISNIAAAKPKPTGERIEHVDDFDFGVRSISNITAEKRQPFRMRPESSNDFDTPLISCIAAAKRKPTRKRTEPVDDFDSGVRSISNIAAQKQQPSRRKLESNNDFDVPPISNIAYAKPRPTRRRIEGTSKKVAFGVHTVTDTTEDKPKLEHKKLPAAADLDFSIFDKPLQRSDRVSISDMSRIVNTSRVEPRNLSTSESTRPKWDATAEAGRILRQKFLEVRQASHHGRAPLSDRSNIPSDSSVMAKPPMRSLMSQLSKRVAAASQNSSGGDAGVLLRSRLLRQTDE